MKPLPSRLKIALLSAGISGVVLVAFGLVTWLLIYEMRIEAVDREIRTLGSRHPGWFAGRSNYDRLPGALEFTFGADYTNQIILLIKDAAGRISHRSPQWPAEIGDEQFERPLAADDKVGAGGYSQRNTNVAARDSTTLDAGVGRGGWGHGPGLGRVGPPPVIFTKKPRFFTAVAAESKWRIGVLGNDEVPLAMGLNQQPVEHELNHLRDAFLAVRDIRHNVGRFALTTVGIGLLLMIVMGVGGIYRGLIREATLVIDNIGADFWVVQGSTRGPFAEISRIPANLEDRLRAVPGVAGARRFVSHTIQREYEGRPLRIVVQGLSWPEDRGDWVPLVAGRPLRQAHFEMIVDRSLRLELGEKVKLGKDAYEVVGLTSGMVGSGGDGLGFFSVSDAEAIQFDQPGEASRLDRQSRRARAEAQDIGRVQPELLERAVGPSSGIPALAPPQVSAVILTIQTGMSAAKVAETISTWPDVTVYSKQQQVDLLLSGMVDKAKRQLGLFRVLLIIISTIIMALIIYTLTLDKIHDIAMLKLMGARNGVIVGLILQQALLIGALGYGLAYWLGTFAFPEFPRLVVIESPDLVQLAVIVFGISVLASLLGIGKAMRVEPNKVLS